MTKPTRRGFLAALAAIPAIIALAPYRAFARLRPERKRLPPIPEPPIEWVEHNRNVVTIPEDGYYHAQVHLSARGAKYIRVRFEINGIEREGGLLRRQGNLEDYGSMATSLFARLDEGDELAVVTDTDSPATFRRASWSVSVMEIERGGVVTNEWGPNE